MRDATFNFKEWRGLGMRMRISELPTRGRSPIMNRGLVLR